MHKVQFADVHFNAENTPVSAQFDDVYFSNQDGLAESHYIFQEGNQLWQRWQQTSEAHFVICGNWLWYRAEFFCSHSAFS